MNNCANKNRACFGKPYFYIFLFVFCGISNFLQAQKLEKYYVSSLVQENTLYHIFPQSGFKNKNASLVYDITYLNSLDSVTFNFSYFGNIPLSIDSITFVDIDFYISIPTKAFFIEPKKKQWEHRQTCRIAYPSACSIFSREQPPKINLYTSTDLISLTISPKKWKEQSQRTAKILSLIFLNKNL